MSEVKCHLEGMPWYYLEESEIECQELQRLCVSCEKCACRNHSYNLGLCDKCATLQGAWRDASYKDKYEKIYMGMTKACKL